MDQLNQFLDGQDSNSDYSGSEYNIELIEIKENDPELENQFYESVLKVYFKEMYKDLVNREVDENPKGLSFKVFAEVSFLSPLVLKTSRHYCGQVFQSHG